MSRVCALTGKKTKSGNNRPFSLKITKRTFRPNLFWKRVLNPLTGRIERMRLSAKAIRTIKKWEAQGAAKAAENAPQAPTQTTTKNRVKKEHLTPKQKKEQQAQVSTEAVQEQKPKVQKDLEKTKKDSK